MGIAATLLRRQTSQAATAMVTYRAVQTGANNQFGGVQWGLASPSYHGAREGRVSQEPSQPAPRQTRMQIRSRIGAHSESNRSPLTPLYFTHERISKQSVNGTWLSMPHIDLFAVFPT